MISPDVRWTSGVSWTLGRIGGKKASRTSLVRMVSFHFAFVLWLEAKKIVLDEGAPQLDLILLPGVAFDNKSNRVGTPLEKTGRG